MATIDEALSAEEAAPAPEPEAAPEPVEVGQGEAEGVAETTEPTRFDPSQYADQVVSVRVNGEDIQVPLQEALNGYMRQADYTRKTQEQAAARQLWDNLNQNPEATIRDLALRQLASQAQQEPVEQVPDDPIQREMYELRQQVEALRAHEEDRQLYRALTQLQSKYGDEFDVQSVATRAYDQGTMDLEGVFLQMQGEKYWAAQSALREDAAQRAQADAAVTAAKSQASQLSGGRSALGGGAPIEDEELSTAEAFRRAQEIHGPLTFG